MMIYTKTTDMNHQIEYSAAFCIALTRHGDWNVTKINLLYSFWTDS